MAHFIQISDIHIGDLCGGKPSWAPYIPILGGGLGHCDNICRALMNFITAQYEDNLNQGGDGLFPRMILTGDLSACGSLEQLNKAAGYLDAPTSVSDTAPIGWGAYGWRQRKVPGNHDNWGGGTLLDRLQRIPEFPGFFDPIPATVSITVPLDGMDVTVRFIMIDTDADVGAGSNRRATARGAFASQFGHQDISWMKKQPPERDEVRVLLLHHPPRYTAGIGGISAASAVACRNFMEKAGIRVVLCGHTHKPYVGLRRGGSVLESCCGTTTQQSHVSPAGARFFSQHRTTYTGLRKFFHRRKWPVDPANDMSMRLCHNALVVHDLFRRQNAVYWRSVTYILSAGAFVHHKHMQNEVRASGFSYGPYEERIQVLP